MPNYQVEIQHDFLERQSKAQPISALAELIWNALDADATKVIVDFVYDGLGGIKSIVVSDNGCGISFHDALAQFRSLGGSWKAIGALTPGLHRQLHGHEGRGRFKAFALGAVVEWNSTYLRDEKFYRFGLTILESNIKQVRIDDEESEISDSAPTGVIVRISEIKKNIPTFKSEGAVQQLAEIFANGLSRCLR